MESSIKPLLSLESLENVGITETCIDETILTLEKISKFLAAGTFSLTNKRKTPAKFNRLRWASKKFANAVANSGIETLNKDSPMTKLLVQKISKESGICRLRIKKGIRTRQLYKDVDENIAKITNIQPRIMDATHPPQIDNLEGNDNEYEIIESNSESQAIYPISQKCYICKAKFTKVHKFYDQMCSPCADFNYDKRSQTADLSGKVALVTGGRIKIGYEVVLKLLRCGISRVITTTRFPHDAAKRYSNEPDFEIWKDRLDIYGLDLRFLGAVEKFCQHVTETYSHLDIVIQNAAQTIRRPPTFYAHLIREEALSLSSSEVLSPLIKTFHNKYNNCLTMKAAKFCLNNASSTTGEPLSLSTDITQCSPSALASQLIVHPEDLLEENNTLFPAGHFDNDHQQLDLRSTNSWMLETPEIETAELVEVSLVNSIAPFILLTKLTPILKNSCSPATWTNGVKTDAGKCGWIILVSAMEGQFYRAKSSRHPHTNCAKASLNMLVRTSGQYYARFGLLMNAVDTGWVTDEVPMELRKQCKNTSTFVPPLDEIDGVARILDPIFQSVNHNIFEYGKFYKDYKQTSW